MACLHHHLRRPQDATVHAVALAGDLDDLAVAVALGLGVADDLVLEGIEIGALGFDALQTLGGENGAQLSLNEAKPLQPAAFRL